MGCLLRAGSRGLGTLSRKPHKASKSRSRHASWTAELVEGPEAMGGFGFLGLRVGKKGGPGISYQAKPCFKGKYRQAGLPRHEHNIPQNLIIKAPMAGLIVGVGLTYCSAKAKQQFVDTLNP